MLAAASIKRMVKTSDDTRHVRLGEGTPWNGIKPASLIERASNAAGLLLGSTYGELVYSVLEGCKRGQVQAYMARILLERCLPQERPTPVQLPIIDTAHDLVEADRRLMAAANSGAISHREWRTGQDCILASWEIRRQARLEEP